VIRQFTVLASAALVFCGVESTFAEPSPQHVRASSDSVKSVAVEVQKGSGKVSVESRVLPVQIELPSQKTVPEIVLMFYDPGSKAFWWEERLPLEPALGTLLPRNSVMFLSDSKFILFWNGWVSGDSVFVLESTEHYSSLNEGQAHVLQELEARRDDIQAGRFLHRYKETKPFGLDRAFLYKKNVANAIGPTLRDVKRVGDEWHIVEDGPNGGSALIVLNDQYEVVSTTMLPSK
jgi:hypothetical protein